MSTENLNNDEFGLQKQNYEIQTEDQVKELRTNLENFKKLLHRVPVASKVRELKGVKYIPISFIEKDLDKMFFGLVQYEIINFSQVLNEFVVHARIKVFHPVIRQWMNYDGIGSGMFQQRSGTKLVDFHSEKIANGGKLTVPNAYAEAIKNAAKKIGKRFGSDLNREHEDSYEGFIKEQPSSKPLNRQ